MSNNLSGEDKNVVQEVKESKPVTILLLTNRDSDNIGDQVIEASDIGLISAVMKNLNITNYKIKRCWSHSD